MRNLQILFSDVSVPGSTRTLPKISLFSGLQELLKPISHCFSSVCSLAGLIIPRILDSYHGKNSITKKVIFLWIANKDR